MPPPAPRPVRGLALYPFLAEAPNELSIRPGDALLAYYRVDSRWLYVRKEGTRLAGYVPFLYCRLLPDRPPGLHHRPPDDTSSLSSVASMSDPGLPSPTSSTSSANTAADLAPPLPLRHGTPTEPWLGARASCLQDSFDSGVSSLRSSGRGELPASAAPASASFPPPPRPPRRPPARPPCGPATCLRGPPAPRSAKKKQVTFSSSAPEVFLTPKYAANLGDSAEDIVNLDDLLARDVVTTTPPPPPPPQPLLPPEMELYETFVSAMDPNGDVETVTLV